MDILNSCDESVLEKTIDRACLNITNLDDKYTLEVWAQSQECYNCSVWRFLSLQPRFQFALLMNSTYPTDIYVRPSYSTFNLYKYAYHFTQNGLYSVSFNSSHFSDIVTVKEGNNEYEVIWITFLIPLCLWLAWTVVCIFLLKLQEQRNAVSDGDEHIQALVREEENVIEESSPEPQICNRPTIEAGTRMRLLSLDTFRGIAIALMIFVNYRGGKFYFFNHSPWNGLTFADLVFPWFLWIMGVSLVLSINSQKQKGVSYQNIVLKILKRSLTLFALGIIINSTKSNFLPKFRIFGVLQRFSFCYGINALLEALGSVNCQSVTEALRFSWLKDIMYSWLQWSVIGLLIIIHTVLVFTLPVTDCPIGYLGPGGLHDHGKYRKCTGGATGYIDRVILGNNHMYGHPTCKIIYDSTVPFDPEGVLGILTSCLTVQFGVAAGRIILHYSNSSARITRWLLWGILLGLTSGILCSWRKEGGYIPVNKNLWSLSYVFVTASFAFFLLVFLYLTIDVSGRWNGGIFRIAGMNAILLYVGHELTKNVFPWSWTPVQHNHTSYFLISLWGTCLWMLISWVCHKKKFYLTI